VVSPLLDAADWLIRTVSLLVAEWRPIVWLIAGSAIYWSIATSNRMERAGDRLLAALVRPVRALRGRAT
jgi:hypothetical protein